MKHISLSIFIGYLFLGGLLGACSDENIDAAWGNEIREQIEKNIYSGNLLLNTQQKGDSTLFNFEEGSMCILTASIATLTESKNNWKTILELTNGTQMEVPTLGYSLGLTEKNFKINPNGYAPLTASLSISFLVEGRLKVCVKGKHGAQTDIIHLFQKYGFNHSEYIHGLYDNSENTIVVTLTDKKGKERISESVKLTTPALIKISEYETIPLTEWLPKIATTISKPERMEPGLTLISYQGGGEYDAHRPFMIDAAGDVRWALVLKNHPTLNLVSHVGFKRLQNGNFLSGDFRKGDIYELDMVGNMINKWEISKEHFHFHHDIIEKPNGNFLISVSNMDERDDDDYTVFDWIIELDPEANKIVRKWDLKTSLDRSRNTLIPPADTVAIKGNWVHVNGLAYSAEDDCIIVSCRYQGICKLNSNNELVWLLSPHKNCKQQTALLKPVDSSGNPIINQRILDGEIENDEFEWAWGTHCPQILSNGHILVFDNGYYRHYKEVDLYSKEGYSRAVEYAVDDKNKTVQQVWDYGREEGRRCYAIAVSSVQYLPETNNVLYAPGVGTPNINGVGGKVIEVDYQTKEILYEVQMSCPTYLVFHRAVRMSLYQSNI